MPEVLNEDITITIEVKANADVGYIDEYDITNNLRELVDDNLKVESYSGCLRLQDVNIKDIY
ncbi:hypothetical protein HOR18_gp056 [Staphylococcus phage vB_SscM-1]|uniref:Uncharacterized protein n=3 Tax=Sciuriunavirus TaxID=2732971 RepID=A0A1X9I9S8_9CAUD|nr:hypothetical protein HOR18_gp056 [Staphylococcus phage vB_SscM-1]ANT44719.1 hypothetical protein vB_SscM-1_056 [Staphylococcus phage vB_SscM-1]ANT44921.1 hypothetical protein vB_SscM-2_054 [Staphylococcus phage vB_SscM-2]QQV88447.1 hypothetical protein [Staphylococcus phage ZCSS1]